MLSVVIASPLFDTSMIVCTSWSRREVMVMAVAWASLAFFIRFIIICEMSPWSA